MKLVRLPFSFLFPLLELIIWLILVPLPTTLIYMGLHKSTQSETIHTEIGTFTLSPQDVRQFAIESRAMTTSHLITALNTPGVSVEMLISLPTSWPSMWHPAKMPPDVWRSITLPFFCLPAWWFVGSGFDSLFGRRKLRWPVTLFGTLLSVAFIVLFCGLCWVSRGEGTDGGWILWGMALWAVLFSVFPLAWFMRRRVSHAERQHPISL